MNSEDLARGIMKLLFDSNLKISIENNLKKLKLGTESEIYKLYDLID